jgi:hypothetical protein
MLERLERQKTLTLNQWKIIATANVGDMLDFFDFFLIGYVLAFILKDSPLPAGPSPQPSPRKRGEGGTRAKAWEGEGQARRGLGAATSPTA